MNTKLIIWDWNGTLFNDVDYSVQVMNKMLIKYKLRTIGIDFYREIFTFPVKKYYEKLGFDFSEYSFEAVGMEFIEAYNRNVDLCGLNENSIETLSNIKNRAIKQVIISAREHNSLIEDVRKQNIECYFDAVIGISDNYASSKLHLFDEVIRDFNFSKEEILLIGDTLHDCEIAEELNINFVHYSKGHQDKSHFKFCDFFQSIYDLSAIMDIII